MKRLLFSIFLIGCGANSSFTASELSDSDEALPDLEPRIGAVRVEVTGMPTRHEVEECMKLEKTPWSVVRFEGSIWNNGDVPFALGEHGCDSTISAHACQEDGRCTNSAYCYDTAHGHHHVKDLTKYSIPGVSDGHKQGFILRDSTCSSTAREDRDEDHLDQISPRCADVYGVGTHCQLVDVSGVAAGTYNLHVRVNPNCNVAGGFKEKDCGNNEIIQQVTVPESAEVTVVPDQSPWQTTVTIDQTRGRMNCANYEGGPQYCVERYEVGSEITLRLPAGFDEYSWRKETPSGSTWMNCEIDAAPECKFVVTDADPIRIKAAAWM